MRQACRYDDECPARRQAHAGSQPSTHDLGRRSSAIWADDERGSFVFREPSYQALSRQDAARRTALGTYRAMIKHSDQRFINWSPRRELLAHVLVKKVHRDLLLYDDSIQLFRMLRVAAPDAMPLSPNSSRLPRSASRFTRPCARDLRKSGQRIFAGLNRLQPTRRRNSVLAHWWLGWPVLNSMAMMPRGPATTTCPRGSDLTDHSGEPTLR